MHSLHENRTEELNSWMNIGRITQGFNNLLLIEPKYIFCITCGKIVPGQMNEQYPDYNYIIV